MQAASTWEIGSLVQGIISLASLVKLNIESGFRSSSLNRSTTVPFLSVDWAGSEQDDLTRVASDKREIVVTARIRNLTAVMNMKHENKRRLRTM